MSTNIIQLLVRIQVVHFYSCLHVVHCSLQETLLRFHVNCHVFANTFLSIRASLPIISHSNQLLDANQAVIGTSNHPTAGSIFPQFVPPATGKIPHTRQGYPTPLDTNYDQLSNTIDKCGYKLINLEKRNDCSQVASTTRGL